MANENAVYVYNSQWLAQLCIGLAQCNPELWNTKKHDHAIVASCTESECNETSAPVRLSDIPKCIRTKMCCERG